MKSIIQPKDQISLSFPPWPANNSGAKKDGSPYISIYIIFLFPFTSISLLFFLSKIYEAFRLTF